MHPAFRGGPAADALVAFARDECRELSGPDVPIWLRILAGYSAMERRVGGPRGTPVLQRVATIRAHAVSLLWRRPIPQTGLTIRPAASDRSSWPGERRR